MATESTSPMLYGTPVVQRRVSIARPPGPPTEPSDVLVLNSRSTSPDSSAIGSNVLYLDLRLSLPITSPAGIDWAFAGLRETVPLEEEKTDAVRYRWRHAIDSHGSGEPPDEGTMIKMINERGEEIELETGLGLNPETGKIGPYEEIWKEETVPLGTPFAFLTSDADPDRSTKFMAVLGPHALGLWRRDDEDALLVDRRGGSSLVHAVRLWRESDEKGWGPLPHYGTVFSTGHLPLEEQLSGFVTELVERAREGRDMWKHGANIVIKDNRGRESSTWTVWDAGYAHH